MGLYVKRDEERTDLQKQIQADLRAKQKQTANQFDDIEKKTVDGVDDSGFIQGTEQSTSMLGVWVGLIVIGLGVIGYLVIKSV